MRIRDMSLDNVAQATISELASPEARLAVERSRAYRFFAESFGYPDEALRDAIADGTLSKGLQTILEASAQPLVEEVDWDALRDSGSGHDDLQIEYTRLFDVGASGPPCSLHGGLYGGARMKNMEESVRFYNHFGLSLSDAQRELPDHITTELEFLHFLSFREAQAIEQGEDPGPYRRAQRDFIERHPGSWVPALEAKLAKNDPMPFFRELVRQTERYLSHDVERLAVLAR
jgi:DMSO reductase family type II enzyme chaperone